MSGSSVDTIFAQATAHGRAGISIIKISGSQALATLSALCAGDVRERAASLRSLRDPETSEVIDQGLILWFPGPRSYTGEDLVELHLHGSLAVTRRMLALLSRRSGHRLAEPGEFTRRAILNGRMDSVQAEGLGDLLAAETEAQRKFAMRGLQGKLSELAETWKGELIAVLALLEVSIDFADEDLPEDVLSEVFARVERVSDAMEASVQGSHRAAQIRAGFEVAIVGRPNVGKSTLLNTLAGREASLISSIAGTTRDVIEVRFDLDGLPVTFLDTAGIRESDDEIESLGILRAIERAEAADVRVYLKEYGECGNPERPEKQEGDLECWAKGDVYPSLDNSISGVTGAGVAEMLDALSRVLAGRVAGASLVAHERQRDAIEKSYDALRDFLARRPDISKVPELAAADIRTALNSLDYLLGKFDIEAVFDQIFRNFCLGK
ncbi:MAG: tRNA uridine-5-carboxymethylaminomethyl(34) synthesis GTPase MnmE [Pseudomonadota bacterium]